MTDESGATESQMPMLTKIITRVVYKHNNRAKIELFALKTSLLVVETCANEAQVTIMQTTIPRLFWCCNNCAMTDKIAFKTCISNYTKHVVESSFFSRFFLKFRSFNSNINRFSNFENHQGL